LGVKLTTYLHLVPRLRVSGAIILFPLYAFMAWRQRTLPFYSILFLSRLRSEECSEYTIFVKEGR
jgi:hypothetical protein